MFSSRGKATGPKGLAVTVAASLALLAACGGNASSETSGTAGKDGVLRVAELADVTTLDPHKGSSGYDHVKLWPIFDTLFTFSQDGMRPEPGLVKEWSFPKPTEMVLELESGVTFHDGEDFNAEAVKANLDRIMDGKDEEISIASDLASIKTVTAVDEDTVMLELVEPNVALPLVLADRAGMMISPATIEAGTVAEKPVGTGPYSFVEWRPGDRLVTERFDGYWGGEPALEGIEFVVNMPDAPTRLNALLSGEVDFAWALRPQDLEQLEDTDGIEVVTEPSVAYYKIYWDPTNAPLDDLKVRQAVNHAIDREALAAAEHGAGKGMPATTFLPEGHWASSENLGEYYEYDLELAKQLMAESKYPEGGEVTLTMNPGSTDQRRMEIVQAQLKEIGIDLKIRSMENVQAVAAFFEERSVHGYTSQWTGRPDPAMTLSAQFGETSYFNAAKYEVPGFAAALSESLATEDETARSAALEKAARAVAEEAMEVPLYFVEMPMAWKSGVEGFVPSISGKPKFNTVTLSD